MLNFAIIVLLPPLLQQHAGYPEFAIGDIIGARGLGSAIGFFAAMPMARLDPRLSLSLGALLQVVTGFWLMSFDLNVDMTRLMLCNMLQGISIGISWVPLTVITFWTLPSQFRAEAMSLFHLFRNFGSSLFISIAVAEIVRTQAANYARMVEHVSPYNRVLEMPWAMGALGGRHRAGPGQAVGRDRAPVDHHRLHQCVGALRAGGRRLHPAVPAGAAAEGASAGTWLRAGLRSPGLRGTL